MSFAKIAQQIEGRSYNDVKNRWSQISRQIEALKVKANHATGSRHSENDSSAGANVRIKKEEPQAAAVERISREPRAATVKYRVCLEGGIPTLTEDVGTNSLEVPIAGARTHRDGAFGPPMSEAEANQIAADPIFSFGNEAHDAI